MRKFLPVLGLILVPALSQAKIGESKADFEAWHTKVTDWKPEPETPAFLAHGARYENAQGDHINVWFRLGKVAGEGHPATKDEDVVRVLQESIAVPRYGACLEPTYGSNPIEQNSNSQTTPDRP